MKLRVPLAVALAGLWATWPSPAWAASVGATAWLAAGVAPRGSWRLAAMAVAATTLVALPATLLSWRAPAAALLAILLLDQEIRTGRDDNASWVPTLSVLVAAGSLFAFLVVWRPSQAALFAPDAITAAVLLLGALGTGAAVVLVE